MNQGLNLIVINLNFCRRVKFCVDSIKLCFFLISDTRLDAPPNEVDTFLIKIGTIDVGPSV